MDKESSFRVFHRKKTSMPSSLSEMSFFNEFGRYFIHGLILTVMSYASFYVFAALSVYMAVYASYVGLLLCVMIALATWGFMNALLCPHFWSFHVRDRWQSLMGQGIPVFIVSELVLLPLPFLGPFITRDNATRVMIFEVLYFFGASVLNGIAGRKIGEYFKVPGKELLFEPPSAKTAGPRAVCPHCGVPFPYRDRDIGIDGIAPCRKCGQPIDDHRYGVSIPNRTQSDREEGPPVR
jgi:hypothetical protein